MSFDALNVKENVILHLIFKLTKQRWIQTSYCTLDTVSIGDGVFLVPYSFRRYLKVFDQVDQVLASLLSINSVSTR